MPVCSTGTAIESTPQELRTQGANEAAPQSGSSETIGSEKSGFGGKILSAQEQEDATDLRTGTFTDSILGNIVTPTGVVGSHQLPRRLR